MAKTDSVFVEESIVSARNFYFGFVAGDAHLNNGVEYRLYQLNDLDKGHPYFLTPDWGFGMIQYDGQEYLSVAMMYNVVEDVVIIDHAYSHFKIKLISDKVESFVLDGHTFVRLTDTGGKGKYTVRTGFYERLVDGPVKLYAKREKGVYEDVKGNKAIKIFLAKDQFFLFKDGKYFPVKNKSTATEALSDRKMELKKYIAGSKISFRKNFESATAAMVKFYNEGKP